ncbi:MAG: hypothetical protein IH869_05855, partial [Chloroflexi bacterium]|nr:hypothetical protein [Chloroflexota bacterium]
METGPLRERPARKARRRRVAGPARQAPPRELAAEAERVERRWVEVGEPVRQDRALPCGGRGLEPLELLDDLDQPSVARQTAPRGGVLPLEQEAQEAGGGHRLDRAAEAPDRRAVDAGQDAAVAELVAGGAGTERAAQHDALGLELGGSLAHRLNVQRQAEGELGDGEGAGGLDAAAHELDDGFLRTRVRRSDALSALGSEPEGAPAGLQRLHAAVRGQIVEPHAPLRRVGGVLGDVGLAQHPQRQQRVVRLVDVADRRPRVLLLLRDGVGVQRAEVLRVLGQSPAQRDRAGAPLLQRRVVQEGIGHRVQDLVREDGGLERVLPVDL